MVTPRTIPSDPEGRIVTSAVYGQPIGLTCKNHPELSWNTKNIAPIGCRTLFFNGDRAGRYVRECDCSLRDLIPIEND